MVFMVGIIHWLKTWLNNNIFIVIKLNFYKLVYLHSSLGFTKGELPMEMVRFIKGDYIYLHISFVF